MADKALQATPSAKFPSIPVSPVSVVLEGNDMTTKEDLVFLVDVHTKQTLTGELISEHFSHMHHVISLPAAPEESKECLV